MAAGGRRNREVPWDRFDSDAYLRHNYARFRAEDRHALAIVRDFFACQAVRGRGIDVGTGVNLYPALSMLPFCSSVTLYEYSEANLKWLAEQVAAEWPTWPTVWEVFWRTLTEHPAYARLGDRARQALVRRVEVVAGSVFDLDAANGRFDLGTMFFVAESITEGFDEFVAAVYGFLGVLRPGSPFAIAFMENSTGYRVGNVSFPAVAIEEQHVAACLADRTTDLTITRIVPDARPIRAGYAGMIVACGRAR